MTFWAMHNFGDIFTRLGQIKKLGAPTQSLLTSTQNRLPTLLNLNPKSQKLQDTAEIPFYSMEVFIVSSSHMITHWLFLIEHQTFLFYLWWMLGCSV